MAKDAYNENDHVVVEEDSSEPPVTVPDAGDTGEGGKLKMIVQLVKKCLGVKDIATMYVPSDIAQISRLIVRERNHKGGCPYQRRYLSRFLT